MSLSAPDAALTDPLLIALEPANDSVPTVPAGFSMLSQGAFKISASDATGATPVSSFPAPLQLTYVATSDQIAALNSTLERLRIARWDGNVWAPLPCAADAGAQSINCTLLQPALVAVLNAPTPGPLEIALANGRFFKEANGFNGAGDAGFAVVDDDLGNFWSEFQRLGGTERVGYPISNRFSYGGAVTQAFQRLALQWQPDLGRVVVVDIFDELHRRGADGWLEQSHQLPSADVEGAANLDPTARMDLLDVFPGVRDFYESDPAAPSIYGLPVATRTLPDVGLVRLQRATFQVWSDPNGLAPTISLMNGGDLAKEMGLWPAEALRPESAPPVSVDSSPQSDP